MRVGDIRFRNDGVYLLARELAPSARGRRCFHTLVLNGCSFRNEEAGDEWPAYEEWFGLFTVSLEML